MASPTWWTWVWESSGSWWWTGKPGMLQSMGSQRAGHNWATELKGNPGPLVDSASQVSRRWVWGTDWPGTRGWSAEGKETVTPLTLFCPFIPVMSLGVWMIKIMLIFLLGWSPFFFFFKVFILCWIITNYQCCEFSGEQWSASAVHKHVPILCPRPPSRLPHNTEQSSLCYTVAPRRLSLLTTSLMLFPYFTQDAFCSYQPLLFKIMIFQSQCVWKFYVFTQPIPYWKVPLGQPFFGSSNLKPKRTPSSSPIQFFLLGFICGWQVYPPTHPIAQYRKHLYSLSFLSLVASKQFSKTTESRTSLVVQWWRLRASKAGGTGLIPGWGSSACHVVKKITESSL